MATSRREFLMAATAAAALTRPGLGATTDWGYPDGALRVGLNENPLGPSPRALKAMAAALAQGHRYPKPQALFERLARLHGVEPEWIVLGSGSGELLRIIPPALARDGEIVTVREAYRSIPSSAERLKIPVQMVPVDAQFRHDLDAMHRAIHSATRVVVVCNPNNPTGTVLPAQSVRQFAESIPEHAVCVIDEAYIHFVPEADCSSLAKERRNVLVLRTFSKAYGLAGLRVGYGIGHPDLIKKLRELALGYNVNVVAFAGALAALEDQAHVERSRAHIRECRRYYQSALASMDVRPVPSETTFFLINTGEDGEEVEKRLQKLNVFVRRGKDWDMPPYIRISHGTMSENRAVVAALRKTLRPAI